MPEIDKAKEEIRDLLQKISEAWLKGDPDELLEFFHEDLVIMSPDIKKMGAGKTACIQSYKNFIAQATVHEYKEYDHTIDVWGDTAVSIYAFDVTYTMKGQTYNETGHDIFVYNRQDDKWLVVWRMVIPAPPKES